MKKEVYSFKARIKKDLKSITQLYDLRNQNKKQTKLKARRKEVVRFKDKSNKEQKNNREK